MTLSKERVEELEKMAAKSPYSASGVANEEILALIAAYRTREAAIGRDIEGLKCVRDNTEAALRQAEAAAGLATAHVGYMKQLVNLARYAVDQAEKSAATDAARREEGQ